MKTIKTDILIIGSGIAGMAFALEAVGMGSVAVITKREPIASASAVAQGGLAAVFASDDSFAMHIHDTEAAGDGLCRSEVVKAIIEDAPDAVRRLIGLGARFDTHSNGTLHLHREGGHSRHRIVHTADQTGREVMSVLLNAVRRRPTVHLYRNHLALDLIPVGNSHEKRCIGAWVLDADRHRIVRFTAKATFLCTGGAGQVFRCTTNPPTATGDGIAMAYRAGAALQDMEFIQFHPTALRARIPLLVTEALRGAGAMLRRADGSSFMEHYHAMESLAPRDITARAVYKESLASPTGITLDARHIGDLHSRFPTIVGQCLAHGINPATDLIPITPAAHYICGGVATDIDGRTTLGGLYACGETACTGLHGANRLASNSLTEALVTARRAAIVAGSDSDLWPEDIPEAPPYPAPEASGRTTAEVTVLREEIGTLMWNHVGIVRSNRGLHIAVRETMNLLHQAEMLLFSGILTEATAELRNLALTAHLVALAAWNRPESRGTHYIEATQSRCSNAAARATGDSNEPAEAGSPCPILKQPIVQ